MGTGTDMDTDQDMVRMAMVTVAGAVEGGGRVDVVMAPEVVEVESS